MIINIRHTGIVVTDLDSQVVFYKALGFIEHDRNLETGTFIEQVTGITEVQLEWVKLKSPDGFLIELLQYHSHPIEHDGRLAKANQLGCSHLAFTVENIDEACKYIEELGGSVVNKPAIALTGKVKVAYCHDPEGVLIEIVEELA